MAREYAIPSTSTFIEDYGLTIAPTPANFNRRVVIIGTAEDGPMYEPIKIDRLEDSETVWRSSAKGDLVRGIFESWGAQESGTPNIVGVRIGNGKKASLVIGEKSGSGLDEEQADAISSLTLEAKYPGSIYNQVTIKYDDNRNIVVYNPKTGVSSKFSVNTGNPNDSSVNVHNVRELVNALNSDRNVSSVVVASTENQTAVMEILIGDNAPYYDPVTGRLDLQRVFNEATSPITYGDSSYVFSTPTLPYALTSGTDWTNNKAKLSTISNNLVTINSIEKIGISGAVTLSFSGRTAAFELSPLDGKGTSLFDTIQALSSQADNLMTHEYIIPDPDGDDEPLVAITMNPATSEYIYSIDNLLVNEVPTVGDELVLTFNTALPIDDSQNTGDSYLLTTLASWFTAKYPTGYTAPSLCYGVLTANVDDVILPFANLAAFPVVGEVGNVYKALDTTKYYSWDDDTVDYIEIVGYAEPILGYGSDAILAPELPSVGTFKITVSKIVDPSSESVDLSAAFDLTDYDGIKVTITPNATEILDTGVVKEQYASYFVKSGSDIIIKSDLYFRITGYTVKGTLVETETLSELEANLGTAVTHYFVRGSEVLVNSAPQFDMIVNYGTRIQFEVGTDISISDTFRGVLSFSNPDNKPAYEERVLLNYEYLPNFPLITAGATALTKGTDGTNLTIKEREAEFRKVYGYLKEFEATFWVPMGAAVDALKDDFNKSTGAKEKSTNSFAVDIIDFLEELSINSIQPHAILSTTQIAGDTIGDRDGWVDNLTNVDVNAINRGANVMLGIQNKFISVAAFEPIFMNTGRGRPYSANGQAAYAGYLASIPYDISPTNKSISNVRAIRKNFSISQLERLTGMRYVTMRTKAGRAPIIVNDITAAPFGSDFVNWTNFSITAEAADRVKYVAEGYLGKPNSIQTRAAMEHDIGSVLGAMSGLQAYNFSLTSTIDQQILGIVEIDLILLPVFTMKKIRTSVKLRKNLPTA